MMCKGTGWGGGSESHLKLAFNLSGSYHWLKVRFVYVGVVNLDLDWAKQSAPDGYDLYGHVLHWRARFCLLLLQYARYLESHSLDAVRNVYRRACKIHLPKKPNIHMAWATFEERQGSKGVL